MPSKQKSAVQVEEKKVSHKDRIRSLIKRPKEKFLTKNQEEYWKILGENQITLCFGPAGVGKSYIAMKCAVDLLSDPKTPYEKIIIVRPAVEAEEKLGALPGNLEEKLDQLEEYRSIQEQELKTTLRRLKDSEFTEIITLDDDEKKPDECEEIFTTAKQIYSSQNRYMKPSKKEEQLFKSYNTLKPLKGTARGR